MFFYVFLRRYTKMMTSKNFISYSAEHIIQAKPLFDIESYTVTYYTYLQELLMCTL